jgi:DNA-binding NarL/FixJ family response regulator
MGVISRIEPEFRPAGFAELTPTQMKVLQGVHSGLLNKQIAYDLGIAEATVKAHMTALMRKLNVRNRTQVAIAAQAAMWSPTRGTATA